MHDFQALPVKINGARLPRDWSRVRAHHHMHSTMLFFDLDDGSGKKRELFNFIVLFN